MIHCMLHVKSAYNSLDREMRNLQSKQIFLGMLA